MIELPEALNLAKQAKAILAGKVIKKGYPPTSPHKFAWFNGDPKDYDKLLSGRVFTDAFAFGIFLELCFDDRFLVINDGVNMRYAASGEKVSDKFNLKIEFASGDSLVFSVAMYGGIVAHSGEYDNNYYQLNKTAVSPLSDEFDEEYFDNLIKSVKKDISVKAFLATEQRIPGIGNGVLQDILLCCKLNPKRKMSSISSGEKSDMLYCIKAVLSDMYERGGRDTEKDMLGRQGGYKTLLSKNSVKNGCPHCGQKIVKQAYLGGSIYFCPDCQNEFKEDG